MDKVTRVSPPVLSTVWRAVTRSPGTRLTHTKPTRTFSPSLLASKMSELGVINVGAAGTFVVWKSIGQAELRRQFLRRLPFETEVMVCSANDVLQLASTRFSTFIYSLMR